jgi:hypothetical protein
MNLSPPSFTLRKKATSFLEILVHSHHAVWWHYLEAHNMVKICVKTVKLYLGTPYRHVGEWSTVPPILNLSTSWRCAVTFMLWPLNLQERSTVTL